MRVWLAPAREDRGASRAVETLAVLLLTTGVVLAVVRGPLHDEISCLAERSIVKLESSGGTVCGDVVAPTRPGTAPLRNV